MEYCLATERNNVLIDAKNIDDFWKHADLNHSSQKTTYYMVLFIGNI